MKRFDADVALVTRATDALGEEFVAAFLREGASRVYAVGETPREWADSRVVPLVFDQAKTGSLTDLVSVARDVTVAVSIPAPEPAAVPLLTVDDGTFTDLVMKNTLGAIHLAGAFGPVLAKNGGGVLVIVRSVQAWISVNGAYAASQAALWSVTNALRVELAYAGIDVVGVVLGLTLRDATGDPSHPRTDARSVATMTLDAISRQDPEVLVDEYCRSVKSRLSQPLVMLYPELG